jgi:formate hydrogenlyase subunit 4
VKARVAGRRGQPLLQAYYDSARLLRKGAVYSTTSTWVFRTSPLVGLATCVSALLLVPFGGAAAALAFPGDLVLFAALLAVGRFLTILGALDTGSSFEGMGASREATFGALAEPALLLSLAALAREAGSGSLSGFIHPLWSDSGVTAMLVLGALGVVLLAENARMPVDDPNTHLELTMIHEVMVLDHSGPDLAFIQYASALKLWLFGALVVGLAVPQPAGWPGFGYAVLGMIAVAAGTGLVESLSARMRMNAVPQLLLSGTALAAIALLLGLR